MRPHTLSLFHRTDHHPLDRPKRERYLSHVPISKSLVQNRNICTPSTAVVPHFCSCSALLVMTSIDRLTRIEAG